MFRWLRKAPPLTDVGTVLGKLCAINERIIDEAVTRGLFTTDEADLSIDTLPGAMHAMAASILRIDGPGELEKLGELFEESERSLRKFTGGETSKMFFALTHYGLDTALGILEARGEADQAEVGHYDKHYWLWKYFVERTVPIKTAELHDPTSPSVTRSLLLAGMGREVAHAAKAPRNHPLFDA